MAQAKLLTFIRIANRDEDARIPIDPKGKRGRSITALYLGDDGKDYAKMFYARGREPSVPVSGTHEELNALKYQGFNENE
jgi:hypothetical protein